MRTQCLDQGTFFTYLVRVSNPFILSMKDAARYRGR